MDACRDVGDVFVGTRGFSRGCEEERVMAEVRQAACSVGATAVHGTTQRIEIRSTPPGATATVLPIDTRATTPAEVYLDRKRVYTVRVEKDGYECAMIPLDRTMSNAFYWNLATGLVIFLGPLFGSMRDFETGAAYALIPSPLEVELRPIDAAPAGAASPCVVRVPDSAADSDDEAIVRARARQRSAALAR